VTVAQYKETMYFDKSGASSKSFDVTQLTLV